MKGTEMNRCWLLKLLGKIKIKPKEDFKPDPNSKVFVLNMACLHFLHLAKANIVIDTYKMEMK